MEKPHEEVSNTVSKSEFASDPSLMTSMLNLSNLNANNSMEDSMISKMGKLKIEQAVKPAESEINESKYFKMPS
jgi:hypothetical protein